MTDDNRRPPSEAGERPGPGPPAGGSLVSWGTRNRLRAYLTYNAWVLAFIFAAAGAILGVALPFLDRSTEINIGLDWDPAAATAALSGIIAGSIALIGFVYRRLARAPASVRLFPPPDPAEFEWRSPQNPIGGELRLDRSLGAPGVPEAAITSQ